MLFALQMAAALAGAMGVGRFVYTPILPIMHAQAGLSDELGAVLATSNYAGYLAGALAGVVVPGLLWSRRTLRGGLVVVVASLALMPLTAAPELWIALRTLGGTASAVVFVIAVSSMARALRGESGYLLGWGVGGVGAGIALSGGVLHVLPDSASWTNAWYLSAALAGVLAAVAWSVRVPGPAAAPESSPVPDGCSGRRRVFVVLLVVYSLEGLGYIIAGTFLPAMIASVGTAGAGSGVWAIVGIAAAVSTVLWTRLGQGVRLPLLLVAALMLQAVGIALPALWPIPVMAVTGAVLFGGTFLAITGMAARIGDSTGVAVAMPLLTTGYSVGQILGPLSVLPVLDRGYGAALLVGAGFVTVAALVAVQLCREDGPRSRRS
ncbi:MULTISPECIES: YbfB/YjiJ family MFS transporter [Pseudonocardia]|uniref:MFS transporter n=1 Tax=Pseudonocardia saturnea TaxID=33909 RepID=A0ABQ0S3R2_9PSEU|nr:MULTISPECIES: YbfB/YjiJ family MFS transporter [Pseudonocardia]BBG00893.1 MFS transporter [Pseudonocardia autotrophica]GEC27548.1 MFS transporter [Pseudonocardia saturnea]